MDSHLPDEVVLGMARAARRGGTGQRLSVHMGDVVVRIISLDETGFTVPEGSPNLRGAVSLYDGPRHMADCLVMRIKGDSELPHYEYKRRTEATDDAPADYVRAAEAPAGLLTQS
jgi:hypothetical protein